MRAARLASPKNVETVADALTAARSAGLSRLDAQLLLGHVLRRERSWVVAHGDAALDAASAASWRQLQQRRAQGEPLAYLVGEKEFHGLALRVDARVLVPRPETEVLVDWALELLRQASAPATFARVLDLGTGSGAIALAVKARVRTAEVFASDNDTQALAVARHNSERHGLDICCRAGSWWQPWAGQHFDLALSNPPYIANDDEHLPALRHEPTAALLGGSDGLDALREVISPAQAHLAPGAWLLLEHGHDQAPAVHRLLEKEGFLNIQTRLDLAGRPRCSGGHR